MVRLFVFFFLFLFFPQFLIPHFSVELKSVDSVTLPPSVHTGNNRPPPSSTTHHLQREGSNGEFVCVLYFYFYFPHVFSLCSFSNKLISIHIIALHGCHLPLSITAQGILNFSMSYRIYFLLIQPTFTPCLVS